MAQWLGYMVSIKCIDQNCYQGQIKSATSSDIALVKAFRNGVPCSPDEVNIRASDIVELKLIEKESNTLTQSTITIAKPVPKRISKQFIDTANTSSKSIGGASTIQNRSKPIEIEPPKTITPSGRNRNKSKSKNSWKDEECFGSPLDPKITKDFDFEKNLALFDKQALWQEINSQQKPDVIKQTDGAKKNTKYRHDENVIASTPATYRQIIVPKQDFREYVTDDGLIIPSISRQLRKKLFEIADRAGLGWERRCELFGRAAADISIQLLGGGHRLNPHNSHQFPTVVVLCGSHRQGAAGINAARQLSSHGVRTAVYLPTPPPHAQPEHDRCVKKELSLFSLTGANVVHTSTATLPNLVDLIIVAVCEESDVPSKCPGDVADWLCRHNKTPILALDPPVSGTPAIQPKYTLVPVLPLPHCASRSGRLYLCNFAFPNALFAEAGIRYRSPFGPKFVIPLHPKDE